DWPVASADEPVLAQQFRRHDGARIEFRREEIEVHHFVFDAKVIVKSSLRHAAMERHLAAFESALELESRSRFRALVSAAGCLAMARTLASADPLLRVLGALRRFQIRQIHYFTSTKWRTL